MRSPWPVAELTRATAALIEVDQLPSIRPGRVLADVIDCPAVPIMKSINLDESLFSENSPLRETGVIRWKQVSWADVDCFSVWGAQRAPPRTPSP